MNDIRLARRKESSLSAFPELVPAEPAPSGVGVTKPAKSLRSKPMQMLGFSPDTLRTKPAAGGQVRTSVLSFTNMNEYGDLLVKYLMARKETFIDRLNWNVPSVDGMEFDQYDTPMCRWVILHEFGEILGGVRLLPTTAKCGVYSYMLRDAQKGLLDQIPRDVLFFDAPVETRTWEASRLFITESVPAGRRLQLQSALMAAMGGAAREVGAKHVIGIVPAVFARWLRRLDLAAVPVGPRFSIDGTNSQAALFNVAERVN